MKRPNKFISFLFILLFCPFIMGAIAAPQSNSNYYSKSQSTDFQVGPKSVSVDDNQSLTLNNDMFNLHGPFSLQAIYSKLFGITFEGTYTQLLGLKDAALIELDLGGKQRRIAGTWGHVLTSNQLFKITAENLSQDLDFDFASGKINKWIYQNAIGGSYAYLIKNSLLNDINVNAYYSKALSKDLSFIDYISGNSVFRDFRRIAGGVDKSASAGIHLLPIPTTLIGIQANYDNVSYNMKNDLSVKRDDKGLGATISLDQLINDHVKFNLLASHRKPYQDYKVELDWLVNSTPGSSLELGFLGERIIGNVGTRNDTQGGVNVKYTWGGNPTSKPVLYDVPKADTGISGLRDWVVNPAVRMDQVLALKDERVEFVRNTVAPSPNMAATNGNEIEVHPGEAKEINITQYFASKTNDKNASKIKYAAKSLPNISGLAYQDGKLIIDKNSFTKKDVGKEIEIDFEPTNINSIPSLSIMSLVLVVKSNDVVPYPNEKYRDTGDEPIKLVLYAGQTYGKTSFIKEDQTGKNQIIINQDEDMYDLNWSDAFTGFDNLKIVPNVEAKKLPGKESWPYSHYYILTYSAPEGIPESAVGHYTAYIQPFINGYPIKGRCTPALKIDITVLPSGPVINWKNQNPTYYVGDKPNEEIADAYASDGHKITDVTIAADGDKKHELSYYGITAKVEGKGTSTAKVTLNSTGVKLPDPADTTQHYKITVTDDKTNKTVAGDFILTVKNGNPTITWKNQKPTYNVGEKPKEEIAIGDASTGYNISDVTITPDGDEGHQLSDYHLTADIAGKGTAQTTITLESTDGVILPDPGAQTQHYKLTLTDGNTNKIVTEDFILIINSDNPCINWKNQNPAYYVGDKPNEEIADAYASSGHKITNVTIAADGDKKHELSYYGITAKVEGKGTSTVKVTLNSTGVKLPDPADTTQHYKITVNDDKTNKTVAEDFILTVKNGKLVVDLKDAKPTYKLDSSPKEKIAIGYASDGHTIKDATITPIGKSKHTLDFYNLEADIVGKGSQQVTITLKAQDGKLVVLPDPNAISQEYQLTVTDDKTNDSVSKNFTLTIDSPWRYSLCPSSDEIQAGRDPKTQYSTVDKIPTLVPGDGNKIDKFHYISQSPVPPGRTYVLYNATYHPGGSPRQIDCNYHDKQYPTITLSMVVFIDDNIDDSFSFMDQARYDDCTSAGNMCKFKYKATSAK